MKKSFEDIINEDLKLDVGLGATQSIGSDSYPYYISELLPNGVVGMYRPDARFDEKHPWYGGSGKVDPFDPSHASDFYIKRRYGSWWKCTKSGTPLKSGYDRKMPNLHFGFACYYQNPSF